MQENKSGIFVCDDVREQRSGHIINTSSVFVYRMETVLLCWTKKALQKRYYPDISNITTWQVLYGNSIGVSTDPLNMSYKIMI